ncbi:MAG: putative glycosyltransferase, exosortase G system-associated [Bacillota bacterium]|nr:putative glycosyltransferase, exosortase G system-associated [Bacillota bacterium]
MQQFIFWSVWLVIPLIWEIITGIVSGIFTASGYRKNKHIKLDFMPEVTVIVPVFNSVNTIGKCLDSIAGQNYPNSRIEIILVNNGKEDGSFEVFQGFQRAHPNMKIRWLNSGRGKSKALNKGIFSSSARYLINIDSDGWLDKDAIRSVAAKFESDKKINCMTGVVLIDPVCIEQSKSKGMKLIQKCELFEYTETFLVGRSFQSMTDSIFTMSGAFSCFRKEALLKTQLYNSDTIGEDTHMTFQIRRFAGGKIKLCSNAFLYTDPIESIDKLYIQRQRWQRGELEVASLFKEMHTGSIKDYFKKFSMRIIVSDHTLAFPRFIWFFALIYLFFINYPLQLLIGANLLLYTAYLLNSFLYLAVSERYLKGQNSVRRYLRKHWYICFVMPLYRFVLYWIRIAGIINSLSSKAQWNLPTLTGEFHILKTSVRKNTIGRMAFLEEFKKFINKG